MKYQILFSGQNKKKKIKMSSAEILPSMLSIDKKLCKDETYQSQCEKMYLLTCDPNEDSNKPVNPHRLIRSSIVRILCYRENIQ